MKRVEKVLKIEFHDKPVYGENAKYMKTKIKIYAISTMTNFQEENATKRKSTMQMFINNNARFCYQSKKKYYPQTPLEECKYEPQNIKMENLNDDDLEKSSSDESDSEADNFLYIDKKNYKTPFLSMKLELFIVLIASFLLIYQKWIL